MFKTAWEKEEIGRGRIKIRFTYFIHCKKFCRLLNYIETRVNFSLKISEKDRRSFGGSSAFLIISRTRLFATVLYITLGETNVWIIPLGAHTWESANRYAIEPPDGGWEHEPRAMCNHSINYVTARSRLFLLRTRARSARRAVARQSRLHRRGRVLLSSLAVLSPLSLCRVPPGHAPFSVWLPGNGKKTPAGSRWDRWRAHSRGRRAALLRFSPPDKSRRSHVETTNSARASTFLLIELP